MCGMISYIVIIGGTLKSVLRIMSESNIKDDTEYMADLRSYNVFLKYPELQNPSPFSSYFEPERSFSEATYSRNDLKEAMKPFNVKVDDYYHDLLIQYEGLRRLEYQQICQINALETYNVSRCAYENGIKPNNGVWDSYSGLAKIAPEYYEAHSQCAILNSESGYHCSETSGSEGIASCAVTACRVGEANCADFLAGQLVSTGEHNLYEYTAPVWDGPNPHYFASAKTMYNMPGLYKTGEGNFAELLNSGEIGVGASVSVRGGGATGRHATTIADVEWNDDHTEVIGVTIQENNYANDARLTVYKKGTPEWMLRMNQNVLYNSTNQWADSVIAKELEPYMQNGKEANLDVYARIPELEAMVNATRDRVYNNIERLRVAEAETLSNNPSYQANYSHQKDLLAQDNALYFEGEADWMGRKPGLYGWLYAEDTLAPSRDVAKQMREDAARSKKAMEQVEGKEQPDESHGIKPKEENKTKPTEYRSKTKQNQTLRRGQKKQTQTLTRVKSGDGMKIIFSEYGR